MKIILNSNFDAHREGFQITAMPGCLGTVHARLYATRGRAGR